MYTASHRRVGSVELGGREEESEGENDETAKPDPKHPERRRAPKTSKEVKQAAAEKLERTVFVGNVPVACIKDKPTQKKVAPRR